MFQKNRFLFVLLFAVQSLFAQIPQGFNYQATVRNQTGELLTNEYVGIRFHIVQGTEQNNPVYSEFHYESTDDLGSLHLMIGQGTVEAGDFNQIDWSLGNYHTGIEINTGSGFIDMGTTQLMSVPFALYALNSGTTNSASLPQGNTVGDLLSWNGSAWTVEDVSATLSPVYLADNGITVKARDWAGIGAKGMLNGVEYTVVDGGMLSDMLYYGIEEVVTKVCTSRVVDMQNLFDEDFNQDLSAWDVSNVTNMYGMFSYAQNFNQDLSAWDVSNVRNMSEMFSYAQNFNQDLSAWDVSNVTSMQYMFSYAQNFNQDLSAWDVSNVTTMEYMFYDAQNFNQDLSAWDVSNVTTMEYMFYDAQSFNQDLSAWDVNNVLGFNDFDAETPSWTLPKPNFISPFYLDANGITVKAKEGTPIGAKGLLNGVEYTVVDSYMLSNRIRNGEDVTKVCTSRVEYMDGGIFHEHFNQDLSAWDVSNVTYMYGMFENATSFNQDLSAWDVSNVTYMYGMFENATSFNQDLSAWDVSNVTYMYGMFENATSFNQDLSAWDVSNVTYMYGMFENATSFNQDLSAWDVRNVTNMSSMFQNAQNFNQDLSAWDVSNVQEYSDFDAETPSWTLPKPNFISPFYLDANGITVKAKEGTPIGAKGLLNGVEYTVVDSYMLSNRIRNGEDVTKVCTSRVEYMDGGMFYDAQYFNQDISSWDVSNVTNMSSMFIYNRGFNQDLSSWDVSNVRDMSHMFSYARNFNQDLSTWDVSNVTTMNDMFYETESFNQPIGSWDVSNVTNMSVMFYNAQNFNQDLSSWDVSNVTNMSEMFYNAQNFNQDLSAWDVSNVQEYLGFDSNAYQWRLPKPNFKITNVSFTSTARGDGTKITITPTSHSIGETRYTIDFNDPAAAEGTDIIETLGGGVTYDYPNEDATYTITVTASNGMESETYSADLMVTFRELLILGSWSIAAEAGALGVGPAQGDISWWSNSEEDVTTRACFFDDTFVFGADGSFANNMGDATWLERWQGAEEEGCGAPVSPYDGAATDYTYTYDEDAGTITVYGVGAHLGMSKVYNGGELSSPSEAAVIESITYTVVEISEDGNTMTVDILFGDGYWTYVLTKN